MAEVKGQDVLIESILIEPFYSKNTVLSSASLLSKEGKLTCKFL